MTIFVPGRATVEPGDVRAALDRNLHDFMGLVEMARTEAAAARPSSAAVWQQIAATHGWLNPNGQFANADLEGLQRRLGESVPDRPSPRPRGQAGNVLHVVTQAYQTGGSTQFLACWVDQDLRRSHQVCLTRQGSVPVPDKLKARRGARFEVNRIDHVAGLLGRAAELRRLARGHDLVLVHSHPYDVVPGLAFAGVSDLPPIVYVDHADHIYWVGTGFAQTVLSMRHSGAEVALTRRAVAAERSLVMPRPLTPRGRRLTRAEAKRELGIDARQVLVVTAADSSKYLPVSGASLLETVLPVLRARPDLTLLAAGPADAGEWQRAREQTSGRVRALGLLPDVSVLQQAADIYLDSFPFSSLTSLLEAGSLGTPVVTYAAHPQSCAVFGADTPGVDEWVSRPKTPEALRSTLTMLADDPGLRRTTGSALHDSIRETHTGSGWLEARDRLESVAAANASPVVTGEPARSVGELDQLVLEVMARTPFSRGLSGAVLDNLALLPTRARLSFRGELEAAGADPRLRDLIPEHVRSRLARLRASARSSFRPKRRPSTSNVQITDLADRSPALLNAADDGN